MALKHTYIRFTEAGISLFLIYSMLFISDGKLAGFPIYSLLLLITALYFMIIKIASCKEEGSAFLQIKSLSDILAIAVVIISVFAAITKLFRNPNEGAIDFSSNAVLVAIALLYIVISSGMRFNVHYFDMILYGGLLVTGVFIYICLTGEPAEGYGQIATADSGVIASYLMLFCMVGIYSYCICKDKLRSCFYFAASLLGFWALFLNQNILSFWLMTVYFISIPIAIRPTARLVKKDMQLFFIFGFMMSNMSLLTGYTNVVLKETSYSLEHSVYLDLLLAVGGLFFFRYWERVPEEIDLDRLVMRRMRRGYQFLLRIMMILLAGIVIGADQWALLSDNTSNAALKSFVLPLVESVRKSESGFYVLFRDKGIIRAFFVIFFLLLLFRQLRKNFSFDKSVTGILILISSVFMIQLFFWKPALHTTVLYYALLLFAAYSTEEKVRVKSVKMKGSALRKCMLISESAPLNTEEKREKPNTQTTKGVYL